MGQVIASGHDFYSSPRVPTRTGTHLAWLVWDHPRMPWDGSELWTADLAPRWRVCRKDNVVVVGGSAWSGAGPEWSASGELHFVSDHTVGGNIYRGEEDGEFENTDADGRRIRHPAVDFRDERRTPCCRRRPDRRA